MVIILMGVAGAGKTTVGRLLASKLSWSFKDADDFHPEVNIAKMRSGIPLTDLDRKPWLDNLRNLISAWIAHRQNVVMACSALKRAYRDCLRAGPAVTFVYLRVSTEVLHQRLRARRGHYLTERMLLSQLETLEEPEHAVAVDGNCAPIEVVAEILAKLEPRDPVT